MLKKIMIVAVFIIGAEGPCSEDVPQPKKAVESIDLSRAINLALTQNKELLRATHNIESSALQIRGANANLEYRIRPEGSAQLAEGGQKDFGYGLSVSKKMDWGTEISLKGRVENKEDYDSGPLHKGRLILSVKQPLFRNFGSKIHLEPIKYAQAQFKQAKIAVELQKADLIFKVIEAFEAIYKLQHQVIFDKESFNRMENLYKVTKAKEGHGRTTRVDTLRVELMQGQASSRLEFDLQQLTSTQKDFAELLGFDPNKVFELKATPSIEINSTDLDKIKAVKTALSNRLEYSKVLLEYRDTIRKTDIARKHLGPDLNLVGSLERFGQGPRSSNITPIDENTWTIGLTIDTDFNKNREKADLGIARINQTAAQKMIKITELKIKREVHQKLLKYKRSLLEIKIAKKNFELAQTRAKLTRRFFDLGRVDNFSVTDAEESFLQAFNQLLNAEALKSISAHQYIKSLGILVEVSNDLKPSSI